MRNRSTQSTRVLAPAQLLRELQEKASPMESLPRRSGAGNAQRRRFAALAAIVGASLLAIGFVIPALAVHDEEFQLDGNTAVDATVTTTVYDWESIFNDGAIGSVGGAGSPSVTLPANFTDADFVEDWSLTAGAFNTSDPTTFTGGSSKDNNDVSEWRCVGTNNVTDKGDITNAYATLYDNGTDRILYFGMEKTTGNRHNNVGLWVLQDPSVGCVGGGTGNGNPFSGTHTDHDLFIVSEFTNGGVVSSVKVYEWLAGAATLLYDGVGCATVGANDPACAATNGVSIDPQWDHYSKTNGLNGDLPAATFYEGGINLSAFPQFADACFSSFLFNTRSSQELTAELYDYALGSINTCHPELSINKEPEAQTNNVGDSFNWTLTVSNTGDGDASDAVVSDTIPAGLTINSATVNPGTAGSCDVTGQDIDCTVDVAAGGSITITVNVTSTLAVFGNSTDGCISVDNTGTVAVAGDTNATDDTDTVQATICRPSVSKTADGSFTRGRNWTIDKSVDPASHVMNAGQSEDSTYTVSVDLTETDSAFGVTGTIHVANPNPEDTMTVDVTDALSSGQSLGAAAISCGAAGDGDDAVIPAGGSIDCTYAFTNLVGLTASSTGTNTATATLNSINFTGTDGYTFSPTFSGEPGTINVTDTFDGGSAEALGSASADKTFPTYDRTFTCPTDESLYNAAGFYTFDKDNTATITETGDSDSETVTVDCYLPTASKTADGAFDRDWDWTIVKSADQTSLTLAVGQSFLVNYTVTVSPTATDSNFNVSGTISVHNPNPEDSMTVDVTDLLSSGESAAATAIDCGAAGDGDDAVIPAGGTINCTYSIAHTVSPAVSDTGTNTATVTLEAGADDPQVTATDTYSFALDNETDECVDVSDTVKGALGTVCADDPVSDLSIEYTYDVGQAVCGEVDIPNIASFVTNDNGDTGSDNWNVHVSIPCNQGCTLTQGYWKTHSSYGPAPSDDAWLLLPGGLGPDTVFYSSGQTWYQVFWTAPKGGNVYYILAHQYEAAVLNILNGASSTPEVDAAIAAANTWFGSHTPTSTLTKAEKATVLGWAATLASYNEGAIGPGHCDEDSLSSNTP